MCNNPAIRRNPKCFVTLITMFIIAIICVIILIAYAIMANMGSTFEDESDDKKTEKMRIKTKLKILS